MYSIVVPCFNEAKNIPLMLGRFGSALKRDDIEVMLVDNGSTDGTPDALAELLPRHPFARSVRVQVNQGYGFGILSGLRAASGDFLGWTHADMQTDPHDAVKACEVLERAADPQRCFVKGGRQGRPVVDRFFTAGMSLFETAYLGVALDDINGQPTLFPRSFFEKWVDPPHDFSLDLYAFYMARRAKMDVVRFPVYFGARAFGQSHWNSGLAARVRFIKRTLVYSAALKERLGKK